MTAELLCRGNKRGPRLITCITGDDNHLRFLLVLFFASTTILLLTAVTVIAAGLLSSLTSAWFVHSFLSGAVNADSNALCVFRPKRQDLEGSLRFRNAVPECLHVSMLWGVKLLVTL